MRPMTISETNLSAVFEFFKKQFTEKNAFASSNTISFTVPNIKLEKKIKLNYMALAWLKMRTLVNEYNQEIAWQGVVTTNEARDRFDVLDILVYPQITAAATVDMNEDTYEAWHQSLNDDQYNNLRLQGHSHVHMGTTPSSTDTKMYGDMLDVLSDNSYYIFMITNKNNSYWYRIFDKKNNCVYSNEDIEVTIEDTNLTEWFKAEKEKYVKPRIYTTSTATTTNKTNVALYHPNTSYSTSNTNNTKKPEYGKDYIGIYDDVESEFQQLMNDPYYSADSFQQVMEDCKNIKKNKENKSNKINKENKTNKKNKKGK